MKAYNQTHLYIEQVLANMEKKKIRGMFVVIHFTICHLQVSDDKEGAVLDHVWLIKDDILPAYNLNLLDK